MSSNLFDLLQLATGSVIGFGVMQTLEAHGITLEDKTTRWRAIGMLSAFSSLWIAVTTLVVGGHAT